MFRKVLKLDVGNKFKLNALLKKRRVLKKENLAVQDLKKALMDADQNVIVMVRG